MKPPEQKTPCNRPICLIVERCIDVDMGWSSSVSGNLCITTTAQDSVVILRYVSDNVAILGYISNHNPEKPRSMAASKPKFVRACPVIHRGINGAVHTQQLTTVKVAVIRVVTT